MALLSSSASATQHKKSMIALATEDDQIANGNSEWNDVGYIQSSSKLNQDDDMEDEANIGISSMNKQKNKMEITEATEELIDQINERENSPQNKQLFSNINEKLQDKSFIEMAVQTNM